MNLTQGGILCQIMGTVFAVCYIVIYRRLKILFPRFNIQLTSSHATAFPNYQAFI